jgi:hypothetical protein
LQRAKAILAKDTKKQWYRIKNPSINSYQVTFNL